MEKSIFESKEQYLEMRKAFKYWYNTENNKERLCASDFALYAALRGKDWRKCFTKNSDEKTIETIFRYLTKTKTQYMFLKPFGETITPEMIESLREIGFKEWSE